MQFRAVGVPIEMRISEGLKETLKRDAGYVKEVVDDLVAFAKALSSVKPS